MVSLASVSFYLEFWLAKCKSNIWCYCCYNFINRSFSIKKNKM